MTTDARRDVLLPALLVLASGLLGIALRPAIPLDETRYLQVASELGTRGPLVLTLNGEPYAHKPPMLFWLGAAMVRLGASLELALRALPAVASAATVVLVARLGRAAGWPLAGWVQASLLAPFACAHALYFDALLTAFTTTALVAWCGERRALGWLAASAALLTKGPAALVHLVPLAWAASAWRDGRRSAWRDAARALGAALVAFVPLAAWALAAGWIGGAELRRELWWSQTVDRIAGRSSHEQGFWFFAVVLTAGALPATLVFAARRPRAVAESAHDRFASRLAWGALVAALVFSLFPGKQPHYVLPIFPTLALLAARRIDASGASGASGAPRASGASPGSIARLRAGVALLALVIGGALAIAWTRRDELLERYGPYADELLASGAWRASVLAAIGVAAAVLALVASGRLGARALLAASTLGLAAAIVPVGVAFGRAVLPRAIEAVLVRERDTPLATFRAQQAGLYNRLARRGTIDALRQPHELAVWCARHPGGLVVLEDKLWANPERARVLERQGLVAVAHDRVRGTPSTLWRVRGTPTGVAR